MTCISPFDNGSYHMGTIRTNRTNRHLGQGAHGIQRLRNILSPPNDMHFSIRQRVVSRNVLLVRIDDSIASAQLFYDSYLFRCIGQPSQNAPNIFEISANSWKSYGFAASKTENTGTNHSHSFVSSIPC